jgi:hypothetical protein
VGLKQNGTHQLLAYPDDVNLLGENTETLIDASKQVGLEINVEKTKYTLLSRHQIFSLSNFIVTSHYRLT